MTKVTFASHPYLLGFEQLDRLVERTAKSGNDGYPPYNIEQRGDASYRITLAVAGFAEADLAITLENNQLVIRGRQADEPTGRVFLHRGIAARQFQRSFVLADGVEVSGATLENGLLHIDLAARRARDDRAHDRDQRQETLKEAAMTDFPSFPDEGDKRIVYVREIKTADLPEEIRAQTAARPPLRDPRPERRGAGAGPRPRPGLRRRPAERVLAGQRALTASATQRSRLEVRTASQPPADAPSHRPALRRPPPAPRARRLGREEPLGVERRHAAHAGRGHRLAVDRVGDVAGGEDPGDRGRGRARAWSPRSRRGAVSSWPCDQLPRPARGRWRRRRPSQGTTRSAPVAHVAQPHAGHAARVVLAQHLVERVVPDRLDLRVPEQPVLQDLARPAARRGGAPASPWWRSWSGTAPPRPRCCRRRSPPPRGRGRRSRRRWRRPRRRSP